MPDFAQLPPLAADSGRLHVVIETPKGSRNKYSYDEQTGLFTLKGVLTEGMYFPYDFGFVPRTRGGDGDPLDVLVLLDEPAFPGCLLEARLLGVLEAYQTNATGNTERNDRLIAVAAESRQHRGYHALAGLPARLVEEIESFFLAYNRAAGGDFKVTRHGGPARARQVLDKARAAFGAEADK